MNFNTLKEWTQEIEDCDPSLCFAPLAMTALGDELPTSELSVWAGYTDDDPSLASCWLPRHL